MRVFKFMALPARLDHVLALIERGAIFFAPPNLLNDPFEYSCTLDFASTSHQAKVAYWSLAPEIAETLKSMNVESQKKYIKDIERQLSSPSELLFQNGTQGVFSTCSTWENLVLWSHYANGHKGIAIEIETDGIEILSRPEWVEYSDSISSVNPYRGIKHQELIRILSRKHSDWAYEKEVRFFCGAGLKTIPVSAIKSVIFGMNSRSVWNEWGKVYSALQNIKDSCEIYQVRSKRTTFKLERYRLDPSLDIWSELIKAPDDSWGG